MRFKAPADTTAIHLPNQTLTVDAKGFVKGEDLTPEDLAALQRNGFVAEPEEPKAKTGA